MLWGDPRAYGIAGLVAAVVAGAQIVGGLLTPVISRLFRRRTSALILLTASSILMLVVIGLVASFWVVMAAIVVWALSRRGQRADPEDVPERHDPLRSSARRSCPSTH